MKAAAAPGAIGIAAERVAEEGFDAVMKNRPLSVPGLSYKAIAALTRTGQAFTARMIAAEALSRT